MELFGMAGVDATLSQLAYQAAQLEDPAALAPGRSGPVRIAGCDAEIRHRQASLTASSRVCIRSGCSQWSRTWRTVHFRPRLVCVIVSEIMLSAMGARRKSILARTPGGSGGSSTDSIIRIRASWETSSVRGHLPVQT
jgi:hypothetical protein